MKIALVHDYLCGVGGSERIFLYLCQAYPDATIFTVAYNKEKCFPEFEDFEIKTSFLDRIIRGPQSFRWLFPLAAVGFYSKKLVGFDLVISSSATVAKYVNTGGAKHLCYCYYPTRAVWYSNDYFRNSFFIKILFQSISWFFKILEIKRVRKIDQIVAISKISKEAIGKIYQRESLIINSPIDDIFQPLNIQREKFYLLVSRLVKWKSVDHVVDCFNANGKMLVIVGEGPEEAALKRKAKPNISFLGAAKDKDLVKLYNSCAAVIFPPRLEYGLIPIEANACGAPVIAFGFGGIEETTVPVNQNADNLNFASAVFYFEQTAESLNSAIRVFEGLSMSEKAIIRQSKGFRRSAFLAKIDEVVKDVVKS